MSHRSRLAGMVGGAVAASLLSVSPGSAEPGAAVPLIAVSPSDGSITIKASALGIAPVTVSGEVAIDRRGKSGSVTTRQSRTMTLAPGETGDIASVSVSFQPGDALAVALVLTENGAVIASASLTTGAKTAE